MAALEQRDELPKAYEHEEVEDRIYQFWLEKGYFTPKIDPSKKPFVIIMPPPNVTGELHIGHALTAALEDTMTRWHRMRGEATLWLPGVDHAGIATQVVVERQLAKEGLTRYDLGREKFLERVWQWISSCRGTIMGQHKKLGVSCDWSRDRFTLDEKPSYAVATTFVRLYNKGLIYRGERITNWCPRCQTALSDLETEHKDSDGHLYYINYPVLGENAHVTVATTRPETMFGDVAVAVNPGDKRFNGLIGKSVAIPVISRPISIIADDAVDLGFGTGALKITPSHDPVDFEVAQRHNLPLVNIFNPDATLNKEAGPYEGFDRFKCREALLPQLQEEGLLVKTEPHLHSVGHCVRCNTAVEPWASKQWFVHTEPLAGPAIQAVREGRITIVPEQFTKVYLHWMENIRDWCISRQLWWGHRIPVWYCEDCKELTVVTTEPTRCIHCNSDKIYQDPDVLDTWFSSALWPHSTLGWPDDTDDFNYFYPTTVMETGYDILFFWVARMIMMGLENTGDIPFSTVYLHGLIRDENGEKMSKIKGNVINPLETIKEYGVDALRFAITTGSAPGNDVRISTQKLEAGRNFANKLWNAARFVIRNLSAPSVDIGLSQTLHLQDRWISSRLDRLVSRVNQLLEDFQFGEAERQIHDFLWGEFCDWYIEMAKIRLKQRESPSPIPILVQTLETSLRLLHPFMPFITEEIWQKLVSYLPRDEVSPNSLMIAPYPTPKGFVDNQAEEDMDEWIEATSFIRNARAESGTEPSRWSDGRGQIYASPDLKTTFISNIGAMEALTRTRFDILDAEQAKKDELGLIRFTKRAKVVLPMTFDLDAEKKRLEKEKDALQARIANNMARLSDETFLSKAPSAIIEKEKGKLINSQDKLKKLEDRLTQLG